MRSLTFAPVLLALAMLGCGDDDTPLADAGPQVADAAARATDAAPGPVDATPADAPPSGRLCYPGAGLLDAAPPDPILAAPSLDCLSLVCLYWPGEPSLCAARCAGDDDCVPDLATPCEGGFTCVAPMAVGPFACQRFCVCRDYAPPETPPGCE